MDQRRDRVCRELELAAKIMDDPAMDGIACARMALEVIQRANRYFPMSEQEQIEAFVSDIKAVIKRYKIEWNLKVASAIGALEIVKLDLYNEQTEEHADD